MARDQELRTDPACERCGAPLVETRSAVVRDGQAYCCVHYGSAAGVRAEPLPEA